MVAAETRCKIKEIKGEMKIADTYYVNVPYGETVNVRTEPSRQSPILFTLPRGTMVTRWGTFGATDGSGDQYYGINTEDGRSGCINSSFLTTSYVDPGDPWIGTYGSTVWKKSLHSGQYHAEVQNIQARSFVRLAIPPLRTPTDTTAPSPKQQSRTFSATGVWPLMATVGTQPNQRFGTILIGPNRTTWFQRNGSVSK